MNFKKKNKKLKQEKLLLNLSLAGSIISVAAELYMSYSTNSQAILMDGVFDAFELFVSLLFVVLLPLLYAPITEKMPYGYAQLESIFLLIKGAMLTTITLGLIRENVLLLLHGGVEIDSLSIAVFEFTMGLLSIFILFTLMHLNKGLSSQAAKGEILSWRLDVFCCLGVSMAFFVQTQLVNTPYAPLGAYIDPLSAIVIALFMLPQTLKMVLKSLKSIILLAPKDAKVAVIKEVCEKAFEDCEYTIDFYDMVQTGRKVWIELYIKTPGNTLDLKKVKALRDEIRKELKPHISDCYIEITPQL